MASCAPRVQTHEFRSSMSCDGVAQLNHRDPRGRAFHSAPLLSGAARAGPWANLKNSGMVTTRSTTGILLCCPDAYNSALSLKPR